MVDSFAKHGPLEKGMANHFSILALRIPWTEDPGGLQSVGSLRVGHDCSDLAHTCPQIMEWEGADPVKMQTLIQ